MVEGFDNKNSLAVREREKERIARKHKVVIVPLFRVLNRVGVQVPLAVASIPVRIHGPQYWVRTPSVAPPLEYSRGCIVCGAIKALQQSVPILFFFETRRSHARSICSMQTEQFWRNEMSRTSRKCTPPLSRYLTGYCNKQKNPLKLCQSFKGSEIQWDKIPKHHSPRESARKHKVASTPPSRVLNRACAQVPLAGASKPVRTHGPQEIFGITDVEDVRPTVDEQGACFAFRLE